MMESKLGFLLLLCVSQGWAGTLEDAEFDPNCNSVYKNLSPEHILCMKPGPGVGVPVDKEDAVKWHNLKRASVTDAADLTAVVWDDELAKMAEHWAKQCSQFGFHDGNKGRQHKDFPGRQVGQNMNHGTVKSAVDNWFNEVKDFEFGKGSINGKAVGHYTQLVWKNLYAVGCGIAKCPNDQQIVICNYFDGYHTNSPYTKGDKCSACPEHCNGDKLCDCGGLVCKNRGKLDLQTCTCKCQQYTSGEDCGKLTCPEKDTHFLCPMIQKNTHCGRAWSGTDKFFEYVCPVLCGLCS